MPCYTKLARTNFYLSYCPQTKFAKVMFSQASVFPQEEAGLHLGGSTSRGRGSACRGGGSASRRVCIREGSASNERGSTFRGTGSAAKGVGVCIHQGLGRPPSSDTMGYGQ